MLHTNQVLHNTIGVSSFPKKHYVGIQFNIISITMGLVGVKVPWEKLYVTCEWPITNMR